ncbi:MAG: helix-turn-helix domain-containing protein [Acidobacteriota bacterium]
MPTLGEELRHKREQRGITLAEIAEATRIGTRFLKAIETDNFPILPGGIFTRSFIRAYAKHVGMNEDEAIGLYLQQVAGPSLEQQDAANEPSKKIPPPEKITKPPPAPSLVKQAVPAATSSRFEPVAFRQSPARTSWPTIVIGAGIVIFIVIIVVALVKQLNQAGGESVSQSSVAQKNAPPKQAPQTGPQPATQPGSRASGQPASTQPSEPSSNPVTVPAGQPLIVKIEAATGDSWIKYQIDDAKPTTLVLKHGQSQDLPPAQTQITLNYGNRLTLKLKINNRDANFPADSQKFKSKVVISRDNFQTYFQ